MEVVHDLKFLLKHEIEIQSPNPDDELLINIDPEMIEQVLINLILNAIQAVKNVNNKSIKIQTSISQDNTLVMISDNGSGIENDILDAQGRIILQEILDANDESIDLSVIDNQRNKEHYTSPHYEHM